MKVLVAAEDTGSIKVVDMGLSGSDIGKEKCIHFGSEGRSSYVQKMILIHRNNKRFIVVARKGGIVQMYDADTFQQVREWKPGSNVKGAIIGLEYINDKIVFCTVKGTVVVQDIDSNKVSLTSIQSPVSCFRMHANQPGVAAAGGKDREIEIIQVFPELRTAYETSTPSDSIRDSQSDERTNSGRARAAVSAIYGTATNRNNNNNNNNNINNNTAGFSGINNLSSLSGLNSSLRRRLSSISTSPSSSEDEGEDESPALLRIRDMRLQHTARGSAARITIPENFDSKSRCWRLWKSKDPKVDSEGYPSPIWVSDLQFLNLGRQSNDGWKIAAATRYGEIRIYDTSASKFPIINVQVSDHPLVNLWFGLDERQLIFTDTQHNTGKFDSILGENPQRYRTAPGGGLHIGVVHSGQRPLIASGGLDKQLRVYDLDNGSLTAKVGIHSRISAILVVDPSETQASQRGVKRRDDETDGDQTISGEDSANNGNSYKRLRAA